MQTLWHPGCELGGKRKLVKHKAPSTPVNIRQEKSWRKSLYWTIHLPSGSAMHVARMLEELCRSPQRTNICAFLFISHSMSIKSAGSMLQITSIFWISWCGSKSARKQSVAEDQIYDDGFARINSVTYLEFFGQRSDFIEISIAFLQWAASGRKSVSIQTTNSTISKSEPG